MADASAPEPTVLLSYDVAGGARSLAVCVCHLVFGRGDGRDPSPPPYIRRPGVVWVGQSVLLLPAPLANELATKLRGLGVRVATASVRMGPGELGAFRRGTPRRRGAGGAPPGEPPQASCLGTSMERP